jgi:hypothetical protein
VRQISLAFADAIGGTRPDIFEAQVDLTTALVVGGALLLLTTLIAVRRLRAFEISGEAA